MCVYVCVCVCVCDVPCVLMVTGEEHTGSPTSSRDGSITPTNEELETLEEPSTPKSSTLGTENSRKYMYMHMYMYM